jgi:hypothetical protein
MRPLPHGWLVEGFSEDAWRGDSSTRPLWFPVDGCNEMEVEDVVGARE